MISIAMTTYNGGKYIRKQIESILSQTIKDFELIICDDLSTDNTIDIIKEFVDKDERISLYVNECNLGFKRNFEKAIGLCKGEYIALSDQDDIWLPNHLEILINKIGNNMLACGDSTFIDENDNLLNMKLSYQEALDFFPDNDLDKAMSILFFRNPFQGASMLIKKDFFDKALPIPENFKFHDSWFSMLACFYGGISCCPDVVTYYRQHTNNVTGNRNCRRKSRLKHIVMQLLYPSFLNERIYAIEGIRERLQNLTKEQVVFLSKAEYNFKNRHSIKGRLYNVLFVVRNYKKIYSCK